MYKRKGISLIVLVITILVMIILAGVVVVSLQKNNPIEKAKEANFKTDLATFKEALELYHTNEIANNSNYQKNSINAIRANVATDEEHFNNMKKYINSMTKEYSKKFNIVNGELVYIGTNANEQSWANGGANSDNNESNINPNKFIMKGNGPVYFFDTIRTADNGTIFLVTNQATDLGEVPPGVKPDVGYMLVYKLDSKGREVWKKTWHFSPESGYSNLPLNIEQLKDGNYIITGNDLTQNYTTEKVSCFAMKIDGNGNLIWQKRYENPDGDSLIYSRVESIVDSDGNILIPAAQTDRSTLVTYPILYKINPSDGSVIWKNKLADDLTGIRKVIEDSRGYVTLSGNGKISILDKSTGNVKSSLLVEDHLYAAHIDKVADGKYILANATDIGEAKVINVDLTTNTYKTLINDIKAKAYHTGYYTKALSDGTIIVVTDDIYVRRYNASTGELIAEKKFATESNTSEDTTVVHSIRENKDGTITIVGMTTASELFGTTINSGSIAGFCLRINKDLTDVK